MKDSISTHTKLPAYSNIIYGNLYNDLERCKTYDTNWSAKIRSLGQYDRLVNSIFKDIKPGQSVLQLGATLGSQIDETFKKIGAYTKYDIIDINKNQIARCEKKYPKDIYPSISFIHSDATSYKGEKADVVLCFMILQELPVVSKKKLVDNALSSVKDGGSVIFVDWHNPIVWHPLRYIARMFNRLYNPFVEKLWDRDIETFADDRADFNKLNLLVSAFVWLEVLRFFMI